jgi:hypothetical protein
MSPLPVRNLDSVSRPSGLGWVQRAESRRRKPLYRATASRIMLATLAAAAKPAPNQSA